MGECENFYFREPKLRVPEYVGRKKTFFYIHASLSWQITCAYKYAGGEGGGLSHFMPLFSLPPRAENKRVGGVETFFFFFWEERVSEFAQKKSNSFGTEASSALFCMHVCRISFFQKRIFFWNLFCAHLFSFFQRKKNLRFALFFFFSSFLRINRESFP